MEDIGYYGGGARDFQIYSSPSSTHSIFDISFSELPSSEYNYFLYGFKDEQDFEEFKQDLRDFQKLKKEFCSNSLEDDCGVIDVVDLKDLHFICRPNYTRKNRRGSANRSSQGLKQNSTGSPRQQKVWPLEKPHSQAAVDVQDVSSFSQNKMNCVSSHERTYQISMLHRPDSVISRSDFVIKNNVLEPEINSNTEPSINDVLVEFLNGDEHFREFEHIFNTVTNRRLSRDVNVSRRTPSNRNSQSSEQSYREEVSLEDTPPYKCVHDIFAEFFNNDEVFLEFEKEFDKFRSNRRSSTLGNNDRRLSTLGNNDRRSSTLENNDRRLSTLGNNDKRSSTLGNNGDINTSNYVLNDMTEGYGKNIDPRHIVDGSYTQDEPTEIPRDQRSSRDLICHSVTAWAKMLLKMKRYSFLQLDALPSKYHPRHRHSVSGMSSDDKPQERCYKAQSLVDFDLAQGRKSVSNKPVNGLMQQQLCYNASKTQHSKLKFRLDRSSNTQTNDIKYEDSDAKQQKPSIPDLDYLSLFSANTKNNNLWSKDCMSSGHSLYNNEVDNDLYIDETDNDLYNNETDNDLYIYETDYVPSMNSSWSDFRLTHSLPKMESSSQCTEEGARNNSLTIFEQSDCHCRIDADPTDPVAHTVSHRSVCNRQFADYTHSHCDNDNISACSLWRRSPSEASLPLSDVDSECYHTATSDLSDQFSTAKSDLSVFVQEYVSNSCSRSQSFNISESPNLDGRAPTCLSEWSKKCPKETVRRPPRIRRQYNSYHGTDAQAMYSYDRPRSGSACQDTCQDTCQQVFTPIVTLSCKLLSDNKHDINIADRALHPENQPDITAVKRALDPNDVCDAGTKTQNPNDKHDVTAAVRNKDPDDDATGSNALDPDDKYNVMAQVRNKDPLDLQPHLETVAMSKGYSPDTVGVLCRISNRETNVLGFRACENSELVQNSHQQTHGTGFRMDMHSGLTHISIDNLKSPKSQQHLSQNEDFSITCSDLLSDHGTVSGPVTDPLQKRHASTQVPHTSTQVPHSSTQVPHSSTQVPHSSTHVLHTLWCEFSSLQCSDIHAGSLQLQLNPRLQSSSPQHPGLDISTRTNTSSFSSTTISSTDVTECARNVHDENTGLDVSEVYRRLDEETNSKLIMEKEETDSGHKSGRVSDDKLSIINSQISHSQISHSQISHSQQNLKEKVDNHNNVMPAANLEMTGEESFQGFLKVTLNLIRLITMGLDTRPPSVYELLTKEHIVEENTKEVAFYMPRDTHKSLHITSDTTTKEVVMLLLKKFHILDHPRKFAMYEQEFNDQNKLVHLRRLTDKDFPLRTIVNWDPERIGNYRMVLQENETEEIMWEAFSMPELDNFLRVLHHEEKETLARLKQKYAYMKQYIEQRLAELGNECGKYTKCKT